MSERNGMNSSAPYRPSLRQQAGFGLLETLAGILVFVLLAVLGSRAYKHVVQGQKAARQVKSMTDLVTNTAEDLSRLGVSVLTRSGSGYLKWSEPELVGEGPLHYRFKIVPSPEMGGQKDEKVAGLMVEAGTYDDGTFVPTRSFAALIAPHMGSMNEKNEVSTQEEREREAQFFASLRQKIDQTQKQAVSENARYLNSFSCYDKGECCGFMKEYLANPSIVPTDGLKEKCWYRCALEGNTKVKDWNKTCRYDMCQLAKWKSKTDCCEAINSGNCLPGSLCASVCLDCVGENGSGCPLPKCTDWVWNDLVDCETGDYCNGDAIPSDPLAGVGNVKGICQLEVCQGIKSECENRVTSCCKNYYIPDRAGYGSDPKIAALCKTVTSQNERCSSQLEAGFYNLHCSNSGELQMVQYNGKWYCGNKNWNEFCNAVKGCGYIPPPSNGPGNPALCIPFPFAWTDKPWQDPNPPPPASMGGMGPGMGGGNVLGPASLLGGSSSKRNSTNRNGGGFSSWGGRE
jgi:hypothetical protein